MNSYHECIKSRFEDIRRDGGSIYVNILELIENAFEWGGSERINIKVREGKLSIRDYGENGFIDLDSLKRFFKLGIRNDKVNETTIGKYGKGGYKSLITLGTSITIISKINDKYYKIGTDFNTMIEENISNPTISVREISEGFLEEEGFIIDDNGNNGTLMSINLRDIYNNKINMKDFDRVITRAYHDCYKGKIVKIDICNNIKEIMIGSNNLIENYRSKVINKLVFNTDEYKYKNYNSKYKLKDNEIYIGEIEEYVLNSMLTQLEYLGDKPGCDVYRNNRLLNIADPCRNIGINGELMDKGQMRGMRCHIVLKFSDKKISENISVDDHVATSTQKELTCTDKMDSSLVKCIEAASKNCNKQYEDIVKEEKELLKEFINNLEKKIISNELTLKQCLSFKSEIENFKNNQAYYKIDGGFKFCSKNEFDSNMHEVKVRVNNPVLKKMTSNSFKSKLNQLIKIKEKEELIKRLNELYGNIIPIISKYQNHIHNILLMKKKIEQGKLEKEIQEKLEKARKEKEKKEKYRLEKEKQEKKAREEQNNIEEVILSDKESDSESEESDESETDEEILEDYYDTNNELYIEIILTHSEDKIKITSEDFQKIKESFYKKNIP